MSNTLQYDDCYVIGQSDFSGYLKIVPKDKTQLKDGKLFLTQKTLYQILQEYMGNDIISHIEKGDVDILILFLLKLAFDYEQSFEKIEKEEIDKIFTSNNHYDPLPTVVINPPNVKDQNIDEYILIEAKYIFAFVIQQLQNDRFKQIDFENKVNYLLTIKNKFCK